MDRTLDCFQTEWYVHWDCRLVLSTLCRSILLVSQLSFCVFNKAQFGCHYKNRICNHLQNIYAIILVPNQVLRKLGNCKYNIVASLLGTKGFRVNITTVLLVYIVRGHIQSLVYIDMTFPKWAIFTIIDMMLPKWAIFTMGLYGEISHFLSDQVEI